MRDPMTIGPNPHAPGTPEHMLHQLRLSGFHVFAAIMEGLMKQVRQ